MFSKYKYVYAVYKEQNFTRAAEKLFISQPSLSVAIKKIEDEVGAPLFERYGGQVRLTEIGREYITASEQIMSAESDFYRKINDVYSLEAGSLTVGGSNFLSSSILPKIITRFSSLHPSIKVNLVEANSSILKKMMHEEEIDIMIESFFSFDGMYEGTPLTREKIFLCVPTSFAINEKFKEYSITLEDIRSGNEKINNIPPVKIESFKKENFILLKSGNDMHDRAMRIFEHSSITPNVLFYVDQLNISYALAETGMGLCFVTDTLVKYGEAQRGVLFYNVDDYSPARSLYVAYKHGRYCSSAMKEFIKTAVDTLR